MRRWNLPSGGLGMLLLGVWLIVYGVLILAPGLNFSGSGTLLAILAVVAGIPDSSRAVTDRATVRALVRQQTARRVRVTRVRNWETGRMQPAEHEVKTLAEALTVQELTGKAESPGRNCGAEGGKP